MKRCRACDTWKEPGEFYKNRAHRDGLESRCRECHKKYDYARYHDPGPLGERYRKDGKVSQEKRKLPEHPYTWTNREANWRRQGILCLPGCSNNRGFFCREHWWTLWEFQEHRCGLCGGLLTRGMKPYPAVDHKHEGSNGEGPVRGILHGGKVGCNTKILHNFETQGRITRDFSDNELLAACEAYVANPPAQRLYRLLSATIPTIVGGDSPRDSPGILPGVSPDSPPTIPPVSPDSRPDSPPIVRRLSPDSPPTIPQ